MYKTLLVPFDGSPFSARALPLAARIAKQTGATLHLVMAHDPGAYIPFVAGEIAVPIYDAELIREQRQHDQRLLDDEAARLSALEGLLVTTRLIEGTTVDALLAYGKENAANLTVMTTHGRGGFQRVSLGSTTTAYLARATMPVLLIHGDESGHDVTDISGPLLCPLDCSPLAESVLPHARTFAAVLGLRLALVSVAVPHPMPMAPLGTELLADPAALDAEVRGCAEYLQRVAATCPPQTTTNAVSDLSVDRAILDEAKRISAGAIALATHGRGGLMRMMFGSVTDAIIRHSTRPVLVYRPSSEGALK